MSEKHSSLLPSPKHEDINSLDHHSRRQMSSHLPPFNMPPGPRTFSPTPGFDHKPEQSHMMSKFPPNNNNPTNGMPSPAGPQGSHDYGQQNSSGGPQGGYISNGMGYWPTSNPGAQNQGQVPFPNQQNPSHLPSLYGSMSQPQGYVYPPPRSAGGNPMPRTGSPHTESNNAPLPPPQQIHDGYGQPQQGQQQQQQGGGQGSAGNYPMYVPQYGGGGNNQGPTHIYGGPAGGGYGGYPAQPYGGPNSGGQPQQSQPQYGGMYSNQVPHSREGSQDTSQWQRSPYGPAPTYPSGGYNGQYAPAPMPNQQQVPYIAGRAGRGASNTGERPFKCDQCPQSFQRSHDLKRHKRIHLAIKPFPCPSCDKSFSRKDALKRHILVKGCGSSET